MKPFGQLARVLLDNCPDGFISRRALPIILSADAMETACFWNMKADHPRSLNLTPPCMVMYRSSVTLKWGVSVESVTDPLKSEPGVSGLNALHNALLKRLQERRRVMKQKHHLDVFIRGAGSLRMARGVVSKEEGLEWQPLGFQVIAVYEARKPSFAGHKCLPFGCLGHRAEVLVEAEGFLAYHSAVNEDMLL
ncbi:hypothetical protein M514_23581 [Trichuris suis]|uniref:Uncharacterized protein n=1 Tax=Trichuris suis TaxID=68888 RepID=A0A085N4A1_9BILA|nr:hypothetical protein M514_23581 [Trichuris suis]